MSLPARFGQIWPAVGIIGLAVRKNTGGADVGTRPRVNLIEGSNVTLTVTDDSTDDEIDVTIAATCAVTRTVGATFDGAGAALDLLGTTECVVQVPAGGTISSYTIVTDGGTGSVSIGVQKSTYASFPTTSDITGGAHAGVSSSTKATDSTLTGWTTTVSAGDVFRFVLRSVSTFTHVTITLSYT